MNLKIALTGLFLAALSTSVAAQSEAAAIAKFKKGFKPSVKVLEQCMNGTDTMPSNSPRYQACLEARNDIVERWKNATDALHGFGSPQVVKLVVSSYQKVEKLAKPLWAKHQKLDDRAKKNWEKVLKATDGEGIPYGRAPSPKENAAIQTFLMSSRRASEARRTITDITTLEDSLRHIVTTMKDPAGFDYLLKSVVGDKKVPLSIKVDGVRAAANLGDAMLPQMTAALDKARKPDVLAALIFGIGILGEKAKGSAPKLVELLGHADAGVAEQAALALQHMKEPTSIKPMIDLLARSNGHAKKRIAAALEILTAQQHSTNVGAWQRWFAKEGAAYAEGKKELGLGKVSAHEEFNKKNYYYGIPQDGGSILYVIDCSGSMVVDKDKPRWQGEAQKSNPIPARKGRSRSDACKEELKRALGQLGGTKKFNIVWYNHAAHLYQKKMMPATPQNVKKASAFVDSLPADSSTNIYDAMKLGFTLTGRGSHDKHYGVEFDTIFLLTDGKPTLQGVGDDDPMKIIEGVRKWNALKRVVIHTIAMGEEGIDHNFMQMLASENRGQYRKVVKGKVSDGSKKEGDPAKPDK